MENAIALGTFDGVHKGHRAVLRLPDTYKKIAVTFSVPPKAVLKGDVSLIQTPEDKCRILKNIGIDEVLLLNFEDVRNMAPQEFLQLLKDKYDPRLISCGFNYRFGKNGEGDCDTIKNFCEKNGIIFKKTEPVRFEDDIISSTYIRGLLKNGLVKEANELLSEPFSFETEVIDGDHRGRTIGFPTANQKYPENLVKLRFGVYKTRIEVEGKIYFGITDIGIRPTYELDYIISETYIKNFSGDLYGKKIRIIPLEFLREEKKFSSLYELEEQIKKDINL
ncbi:MAG: riboflavin biosynthesis protein RibF [Clostridia bacterium]|nr:riboflavin biosynthesis protein RibF [Clostridia bacterium]